MSIRAALIPRLRAAFPDRGLRVLDSSDPVAVFPAACAEVGDLSIYDDGDEATVLIENVTHHHVGPDELDLCEDERAVWIAERVVEFLHDLFADRVLLYSFDQGRGGGGWLFPYDGSIPKDVPREADKFVWSRRLG